MGKLKVVLSLVALLAAGAAVGNDFGPFHLDPAWSEVFLAIGGALTLLGVTPVTVPPMLAKLFGALSIALLAVVARHAASTMGVPGVHEWFYKALATVAMLLGFAARVPAPARPQGPGGAPPAPAT